MRAQARKNERASKKERASKREQVRKRDRASEKEGVSKKELALLSFILVIFHSNNNKANDRRGNPNLPSLLPNVFSFLNKYNSK